MSGIEEFLRANGPDITGTAGDKNVHGSSIEKNAEVKKKIHLRAANQRPRLLEPAFFIRDISVDEVLIALGEIYDTFNYSKDPHHRRPDATRQKADQQHDDPLLGVTQNKFMYSKATQQKGQHAS
jgi:hypothetical protein